MESRALQSEQTARRIRSLREDANLKSWYVAKKVGVSPAQYSRYENAQSRWIPVSVLHKLETLYGKKIDTVSDDKEFLLKRIEKLEKENETLRKMLTERNA